MGLQPEFLLLYLGIIACRLFLLITYINYPYCFESFAILRILLYPGAL